MKTLLKTSRFALSITFLVVSGAAGFATWKATRPKLQLQTCFHSYSGLEPGAKLERRALGEVGFALPVYRHGHHHAFRLKCVSANRPRKLITSTCPLMVTTSDADYGLETVMPGHYSDRPAQHIHYMITAAGHKTLVTQIYFATDPFFEGDVDKNYRKRNIAENRELVRPVSLYEQGAPHAAVSFDIVLERA